MSVRVSTWVWHDTTARGNDLLVLLALADTADDDGSCWPGVSTIAAKTRLDRATVQRRLKVLQSTELVDRITRPGQSNLYRIRVPWGAADCGTPTDQGGRTAAAPGAAQARQGVPHGRGTEPSENRQGTTNGARKRGTRIPDIFRVTPEMREWAAQQGWSHLDLDGITAGFVDYWLGVPGAKGVKLDWPATWRNWVRRKAEDSRRGNAGSSAWSRARVVGEGM